MNEVAKINTALTVIPDDWQSASLVEIRSNKERFPRLCQYSNDAAIQHMSVMVTQAMMLRGQTVERNNIIYIASELVGELMRETTWGCRYITFEEIRRAIRTGVLEGEGCISVASLYRIILNYVKGEGKNAQKTARKRAEKSRMINSLSKSK